MRSLNMQPIERGVYRDDGSVEVVSVFATIQGEGPFVGSPSVFVRTAGCDLQCPACDTDYTTGRRLLSPDGVLEEVRAARRGGLVVITGGEPFRQGLGRVTRKLVLAGYSVQFETNGTLWDPTMDGCWGFPHVSVVCSPKTPIINPQMADRVTHWKYVVSAGQVDPTDGLPLSALGMPGRPYRSPHLADGRMLDRVYVQPCDSKDAAENAANTQAAVDSCMKFGYRLCLQVHKIIDMP